MKMLDNIKIILVNPKYAENVGSVCRAMKTMGFSSLSVVRSKNFPGGYENLDNARPLAVHAVDILDNASFFSTLEAAVEDCSFSVAVSRRRGKRRKYFAILPEQLAEKIPPGARTALVFGNEESGLSEEEMEICNMAVKIPSSPDFPSLNLSHAVQILTYSLFRDLNRKEISPYTPVTGERLEELSHVISSSLENIGFFKMVPPDDLQHFFRDIFARAGLSGNESKRIEVVFRKISGLIADRGIDS